MAGNRGHAALDNPGLFVKPDIRYDFRYFSVGQGVRPRDQQAVTAVNDGPRDEGNLLGGLALPKHDLGKPLAVSAVVVDARETQVFERLSIRCCQIFGASFRVSGIEPALPDRIEKRSQGVEGVGGFRGGLHRFTFDSARAAYLELRIVPRRQSFIL
jgi:hypothetical protein